MIYDKELPGWFCRCPGPEGTLRWHSWSVDFCDDCSTPDPQTAREMFEEDQADDREPAHLSEIEFPEVPMPLKMEDV